MFRNILLREFIRNRKTEPKHLTCFKWNLVFRKTEPKHINLIQLWLCNRNIWIEGIYSKPTVTFFSPLKPKTMRLTNISTHCGTRRYYVLIYDGLIWSKNKTEKEINITLCVWCDKIIILSSDFIKFDLEYVDWLISGYFTKFDKNKWFHYKVIEVSYLDVRLN